MFNVINSVVDPDPMLQNYPLRSVVDLDSLVQQVSDPDPQHQHYYKYYGSRGRLHKCWGRIRIHSAEIMDPRIRLQILILCRSQNFVLTRALLNLLRKGLGHSKPTTLPCNKHIQRNLWRFLRYPSSLNCLL